MSLISTPADILNADEQEWHRQRAMGIGGSEVGALLGVDPYNTPYSLWERKTGRVDNFEGNDFTRAGHLLEPVICQWFTEQTGLKLHEAHHMASPTHPWRRVTPDRLVGDKGLMDAKNSRFEIAPNEVREGKKMAWYFQVIWGIGIWNEVYPEKPRDTGYIVWLGAGYQFQYLGFDYEKEVYDMMCDVVDSFWNNHVLTDTPPPPMTRDDILRAVGKVVPAAKVADEEHAEFFRNLVHAKGEVKKWQSVVDEMQEALQMYMLEHDTLIVDGLPAATWKEQTVQRIDTTRLKAEMPEIAEKYTVQNTTRVFRIK